MYKSCLKTDRTDPKMVKNKRDLKSPKRRTSIGIGNRVTTNAANIKVVVRVRPRNDEEFGDNFRTVIRVVNEQLLIFDPEEEIQPFLYHGTRRKSHDLLKKNNKKMQFFFDRIFGNDSTNEEVFEHTTKNLIDRLMDGCNCSVFAYGATGAGKTYTMLGRNGNPGITFLTMAELFARKEQLSNERDFELGVAYLEVYNETVQDLLNPGALLCLREDGKYGIVVAGIQIKRIESSDQLFELLERGNMNRTQHPTDANEESSRSHAVFQVYLRMFLRATSQVMIAKLSMIDLAGSERGAATGCAGMRFTEGANINKSLLALGNCINSLADGQKHIPYRDSKLTRLLKDSLGGNCQTVMIANVSPTSLSYEDTYNTLRYAVRAKKIKINLKKNVANCEMNLEQYIKMNEKLNKEVERLRSELDGKAICSPESVDQEKRLQLIEMFEEICKLQQRMHQLETNEHLLYADIKIKGDVDARLSHLSTPEKINGRIRFETTIDRMRKELETLQENKTKLIVKVDELLKNNPNLESAYMLEDVKLKTLEKSHQAEHFGKINERLINELECRSLLIENMSNFVRSTYKQMKGHNMLSDTHMKQYRMLLRDFQGVQSVRFESDSGVDSDGSTDVEESRKRKLQDGSTCSLDGRPNSAKSTRTCMTVYADQLLAKAYKPPPAKRVASRIPHSEIRLNLRKPTATMGTAQRFSQIRFVNPSRPASRIVFLK